MRTGDESERTDDVGSYKITCIDFIKDISNDYLAWVDYYKLPEEEDKKRRAVMYNDKIYFSRHRPDGDWFQNAITNQDVKIQIDDSVYVGKAKQVTDENLGMKISELKYPNEERAKEKRVTIEVTLYEQL